MMHTALSHSKKWHSRSVHPYWGANTLIVHQRVKLSTGNFTFYVADFNF